MTEGPGADSEDKHEPVSDIDTAVVDSLKVLDPKRPIREADIPFTSRRGYDGLASEQAGRCQKDYWLGRTS